MTAVTIAHLYSVPPLWTTYQLGQEPFGSGILKGYTFDHMPEWTPGHGVGARYQPNEAVEAHVVLEESEDTVRFWRVARVAWHGVPFMLVCNAGRGGDDYHRRYVTDTRRYDQAVSYLSSLRIGDADLPKTPLHFAEPELVTFYGRTLNGARIPDRPAWA